MIDQNRALESFLRYIAVDSETHHEKPMTELLVRELEALGLTVTVDRVGEDPAVESDSGNIFAVLPGDENLSPMLFSAHQDTVTPGRGIRPRVEDGYVYSDGTTILGADDKSGVAAIMEALRVIREKELPHRPIEILFSVREEGGLRGSAYFDYAPVRSRQAVVLDTGGHAGTIITQAPSQTKLRAEITGKVSHAGSAPEKGVSAIMAGARAVSNMKLLRIDEETTANVGTLSAVGVTNIVNDKALFEAEARSLSPAKLEAQVAHMTACLEEACAHFGAQLRLERTDLYTAYRIPDSDPLVQRIAALCGPLGLEAETCSTGGGADSNNFNQRGITAVVLACGMEQVHTCAERLCLKDFYGAAELVLALMQP